MPELNRPIKRPNQPTQSVASEQALTQSPTPATAPESTVTFEQFDPRAIATPVYQALGRLRANADQEQDPKKTRLKQQRGQAVELYTYLATWGLMRLKAEEAALKKQAGKQEVVQEFFNCLAKLSDVEIASNPGRSTSGSPVDSTLDRLVALNSDEYLGLTGLALSVAREFGFWATAIYADVSDDNFSDNTIEENG